MHWLFIILVLQLPQSHGKNLLLETQEGPVTVTESQNNFVAANIPYAKPPVGSLRWKAPRPPEVRSKIWNGFNKGIVRCAQVGGPIAASAIEDFGKPVGSEDCLYLNINTPKGGSKNKPVFFWIHGGSNTAGYAQDEMYEASRLAQKTDSIVVTVNYRLSHFGGLHHPALSSDNPEDASGNYASLDLIQALKWVQSNIKSFGGDPTRITAAGESAGCINVWGLILSPLAKDLFQQVFCASGFPQLASPSEGQRAANKFIEEAFVLKGLSSESEASAYRKSLSLQEVKSFLYSLSTDDILSLKVPLSPIQYVSDNYVFPNGNVTSLLSTGQFNQAPMMIGATKNEGTWFALKQYFEWESLWTMINGKDSSKKLEQFTKGPQFKDFRKKSRFISELFKSSIIYASQIIHHFPTAPIYRYEINWTAMTSPWKKLLGAAHAYDLPLLFHKTEFQADHFMSYLEPTLKMPESQNVSDQFLLSLKGFLHTGDPNAYSNITWPLWHPTMQFYWPWKMHIDNKGMKAKPTSAILSVVETCSRLLNW